MFAVQFLKCSPWTGKQAFWFWTSWAYMEPCRGPHAQMPHVHSQAAWEIEIDPAAFCLWLHSAVGVTWGYTNSFLESWKMIMSRLKQGSVFLMPEQQTQKELLEVKRPWLGTVPFPTEDDSPPTKKSQRPSLGRLCPDSELNLDHRPNPLPVQSPAPQL